MIYKCQYIHGVYNNLRNLAQVKSKCLKSFLKFLWNHAQWCLLLLHIYGFPVKHYISHASTPTMTGHLQRPDQTLTIIIFKLCWNLTSDKRIPTQYTNSSAGQVMEILAVFGPSTRTLTHYEALDMNTVARYRP